MRVAVSLIKIGAPVFAAAIFGAVPNSQSAYAQSRGVGNPGFAQNRSFGNFRFGRGFDRGRRDFGPNVVVVPSVVGSPLPYYAAPPLGYDVMRCILHRQVETPNGLVSEPVYVC